MDTTKLFTELNNIVVSLEESSKYEISQENLNVLNKYDVVLNDLRRQSSLLSYYSVQLLEELPDQRVILSNQSKVQSYSLLSRKIANFIMGIGFVILILSMITNLGNSKNLNLRLVVIIFLFLSYVGDWITQFVVRKRFGNDKTIQSIKIVIEELKVIEITP